MSEYLIPVGERDVERMDAMCRVFNPFSLELLSRYPAKTFLDVGCGNGGLTNVYARAHPDVQCLGIDSSAQQLALAGTHTFMPDNMELQLGDARKLDFQGSNEQFDVVHTRFVLTHFEDPAGVAADLLKRVKRGGVLIMEEAAGGACNFSQEHQAAKAWVRTFQVQHIIQKSSLETAQLLMKRFPDAETVPFVGKFDSPDKKMAFLEGVKMAVNLLAPKTLPLPDHLNPLVVFNYQGPEWIQEAEALVQDPAFTFEMNPIAVIVRP